MSDITVSAVVTKPNGKLFYKETHEWDEVQQVQIDWFNTELKKAMDNLVKLSHDQKEDGGDYTATLNATVGDTVYPEAVIEHLTYNAVSKQERFWHKIGDELIRDGEKLAKEKARAYKP